MGGQRHVHMPLEGFLVVPALGWGCPWRGWGCCLTSCRHGAAPRQQRLLQTRMALVPRSGSPGLCGWACLSPLGRGNWKGDSEGLWDAWLAEKKGAGSRDHCPV